MAQAIIKPKFFFVFISFSFLSLASAHSSPEDEKVLSERLDFPKISLTKKITNSNSACKPKGPYNLCQLRALSQSCGGENFFKDTWEDVAILERRDPRLPLNLAKAGSLVSYRDEAWLKKKSANALYHPITKMIILKANHIYNYPFLYEAAHAVDDILERDNGLGFFTTLFRMHSQKNGDDARLLSEVKWTASSAMLFLTAASLEFLEAYKEYIRHMKASGFKMSWSNDDIELLVETYMHAFVWYFNDTKNLAHRAPLLYHWVESSVERLGSMSDAELFQARLTVARLNCDLD